MLVLDGMEPGVSALNLGSLGVETRKSRHFDLPQSGSAVAHIDLRLAISRKDRLPARFPRT